MAVMELDKRMVHWKIEVAEKDWTSVLAPYVNSIKVENTILPKKGKEKDFPSKASISIISKDFVESIFIPGISIKIYIGYDKLITKGNLVFQGTIVNYPDGQAEDMLKYTVSAHGGDPGMILQERNRYFIGKNKLQIIQEIMAVHGYNLNISIKDANIIKGEFTPAQLQKGDLLTIQQLAEDWGVVIWFSYPTNTFYMVDAEDAHTYMAKNTYMLGYRTDKTECNVNNVKWRHTPNRAALSSNPGAGVLGEEGDGILDPTYYKQYDLEGRLWVLRAPIKAALNSGDIDLKYKVTKLYFEITAKMGLGFQAYELLKKYWVLKNEGDTTKPETPAHMDSGWEIDVKLNEGDPTIFPPVNAALYYGSLNPRADSSNLPSYLHFYLQHYPYIALRVNEVEHNLNNGKLDTELKCTFGMFD